MKPVYFLNSEFTVIYTQIFTQHHWNSQFTFTTSKYSIVKIGYSQQYSQHRSKIQYSQHQSSIFTLFPSISIKITVQRLNLS
jgi:hypothetical protein